MSEIKNKSKLINEAIVELQDLLEAADKNAKEKIAKELPDKFDSLLKEELNKLQNKDSVKEPVKGTNTKEQPKRVVENTEKKKKESLNEMEEVDLTDKSIDEVEAAYDSATGEDEFDIDLNAIEEELGQMSNIASEIDAEQTAPAQAQMPVENTNDPYEKFRQLHEMMNDMIKEMDNQKLQETAKEEFHQRMSEMYGEDYTTSIDESMVGSMFEAFLSKKKGSSTETPAAPKPISESTDNNSKKETDKKMSDEKKETEVQEIDEVLDNKVVENEESTDEREEEETVDEMHGIDHAKARKVGADTQPRVGKEYRKDRERAAVRESDVKTKSLIEENKKLTKKLNEKNSTITEAKNLVEKYKGHLERYKSQLTEMAIFNTNLAHVNNILLSEGLALTQDEKKQIVNKFKNVNSITESEKVYKNILTEMTSSKKNINESIEDKVNDSIDTSYAPTEKILKEANERTAYENDSHLKEIKMKMFYQRKK